MAQKSVRKVTENNVVRLQTDILIEIGRRLRDPYNEIVDEGVPARFAELLKRLDDPGDQGDQADQADQGEPGRSADVVRLFDSKDEGR